jgi:hypothetical protein
MLRSEMNLLNLFFFLSSFIHIPIFKQVPTNLAAVSNVIIIQKENTKSSVWQHGFPIKAKIGSGAMEE